MHAARAACLPPGGERRSTVAERMRPEEARRWVREGRGMETEFNVPLQWVTRGCNCRSGRNGAGIAADGRGSLITPR